MFCEDNIEEISKNTTMKNYLYPSQDGELKNSDKTISSVSKENYSEWLRGNFRGNDKMKRGGKISYPTKQTHEIEIVEFVGQIIRSYPKVRNIL